MFGKKKRDTPEVEKAVSKGVSFELNLAQRAAKSERRAWIVAWCAVTMSLILAGGYFYFLPLKEKVPYLVMADPYTGTATVARLTGNFHDRDVTTEEAINKSNVAQFVLARESYDSGIIGQRNWQTTLSMAGPTVAPAYQALHSDRNPDRPYRTYGSTQAVRVRILSIVLTGGGSGKRPTGATVRFQRSLYDKVRGRTDPIDAKIATLQFTYNPDLRMNDEYRLLNPLGFRVTDYRVDNDFATPPAPEREFPLPSAVRSAVDPAATAPAAPPPDAMQAPAFDPNDPDNANVAPMVPMPAEQARTD